MERQNAAPCKSYSKLHHYSSHTIHKILPYSQVTIKAMQNGMTGRNTFRYVLINTSILQRRRWGVWRVEASSNCTLLFLKQKTSFMSCVLSGLSPPGHWASTAPRTRWLSAPCITKIYSCIAFMNTNTSFSNKPTQQIFEWCVQHTGCGSWVWPKGNWMIAISFSKIGFQAFVCFLKEPDWQPWRPEVLFIHITSTVQAEACDLNPHWVPWRGASSLHWKNSFSRWRRYLLWVAYLPLGLSPEPANYSQMLAAYFSFPKLLSPPVGQI